MALTILALIFAALIALIFLRLETWPARTAAQSTAELERVGRELRDAFVQMAHLQPRVTINDRVYLEATTPTAEFAVLSRRTEVEHELQHTWAGSTKRVKLHGTYAVKVGFDLSDNLSVDVRPDVIAVQLPHAKVLGVEQERVDVLAFENGLWNRISAEDLEGELARLPELARLRAAQEGLLAEAEHALQVQLDQRLHARAPVRLIFHPATPKD